LAGGRPAGYPVLGPNDYALRVHGVYNSVPASYDNGARVMSGHFLHAGADQRRLRSKQRHGLALHVRPHQRAVGVVVLQERYERSRDRNELLGADVQELQLLASREFELARFSGPGAVLDYAALLVYLDRSLADRVSVLFPRRQIERVRLV